MRGYQVGLWALIALGPMTACKDKTPPQTEIVQRQTAAEITPADARSFAETMEKAIKAKDGPAYNALIDWDALIGIATEGLDLPSALKRSFKSGVQSTGAGGPLAQAIVQALEAGGHYDLVKIREVDGQRRALFRLIMPNDSGMNYHDVILGRGAAGKVRAIDIHVYLTGETLSQTFRRMLIPLAASAGIMGRLSGEESLLVKHIEDVQTMSVAAQSGDRAQALRAYGKLPRALQKEKFIQLMRVTATQTGDEADYIAALDEMQQLFPNDPCMDMLLIDSHFMKKEWDKALASVDRLDKQLDGDPYLDVMRTGLLMEKGEKDEALRRAQSAAKALPDIQESHWSLLTAALMKQDYDLALETMKRLETKFSVQFTDLRGNAEFAGFVASPQFAAWQSRAQ